MTWNQGKLQFRATCTQCHTTYRVIPEWKTHRTNRRKKKNNDDENEKKKSKRIKVSLKMSVAAASTYQCLEKERNVLMIIHASTVHTGRVNVIRLIRRWRRRWRRRRRRRRGKKRKRKQQIIRMSLVCIVVYFWRKTKFDSESIFGLQRNTDCKCYWPRHCGLLFARAARTSKFKHVRTYRKKKFMCCACKQSNKIQNRNKTNYL